MKLKIEKRALSSFILFLFILFIAGCSSESLSTKTLPEEGPETVVKRFYDYISEAKVTEGTLPVREAFKLTGSDNSPLGEARFLEIIKQYPPGFKVDVVKSEINGTHATVTIEYRMASIFGGEYPVRTAIPLYIDKATNTWKIDFTGESDDEDKGALKTAGKGM